MSNNRDRLNQCLENIESAVSATYTCMTLYKNRLILRILRWCYILYVFLNNINLLSYLYKIFGFDCISFPKIGELVLQLHSVCIFNYHHPLDEFTETGLDISTSLKFTIYYCVFRNKYIVKLIG